MSIMEDVNYLRHATEVIRYNNSKTGETVSDPLIDAIANVLSHIKKIEVENGTLKMERTLPCQKQKRE